MESRGKRGAKPRNSYSPDAYNFEYLKDFDEAEEAKKKARNEAIKARNIALKGTYNKWTTYKNTIGKLASLIARDLHYVEVYKYENRDGNFGVGHEKELAKLESRIRSAKESILATFQQIENENKNDKIWIELSMGDANGNVDVSGILCSVCNKEDQEGNDILFCDHAGCCRAYHQYCLDPHIDTSKLKDDEHWFCWNCECMDECLALVGELTGDERENWRDLFPELKAKSLGSAAMLLKSIEDQESSSESEDEDYVPGYLRSKKKKDASVAQEGGENDDDDKEEESDEESNPGSDSESSQDEEDSDDEEGAEEEEESDAAVAAENEGADEEEEEEGDDESVTDSLDDVDDEEISGLLEDAHVPAEQVEALRQEPRRLRPRRAPGEGATGHHALVNPVVPDTVEGGTADLNKKAGRIFRGVIIPGTVVEFIPLSSHVAPPADIPDDVFVETEDTWKVKFEDEVEYIYGKRELNEAFKCYAEYSYQKTRSKVMKEEAKALKALKKEGHSSSSAVTPKGKIDPNNIINHKRGRSSIDYVSLNLEMFGDVSSSSDEDADVSDDDSPQYKRRRGRPSKVGSSSAGGHHIGSHNSSSSSSSSSSSAAAPGALFPRNTTAVSSSSSSAAPKPLAPAAPPAAYAAATAGAPPVTHMSAAPYAAVVPPGARPPMVLSGNGHVAAPQGVVPGAHFASTMVPGGYRPVVQVIPAQQQQQMQHQMLQQQHQQQQQQMRPLTTADVLAARALNEADANLNLAVMDELQGGEI